MNYEKQLIKPKRLRLPKNVAEYRKALDAANQEGYNNGFDAGNQNGYARGKRDGEAFAKHNTQTTETQRKALAQLTALTEQFSKIVEGFAMAMRSEGSTR